MEEGRVGFVAWGRFKGKSDLVRVVWEMKVRLEFLRVKFFKEG